MPTSLYTDHRYDYVLSAKRQFIGDPRGHAVDFDRLRADEFIGSVNADGIFALYTAWTTDVPLEESLKVRLPYYNGCAYCDAREYLFDGFTFTAVEPCPHPNGFAMSVTLAVPSGRLYIGNDFRDEFPVEEEFGINAAHGIRDTVLEYERAKMLHFFVGNSSPSLIKTAPDTFDIGDHYWYDRDDNEHQVDGVEVARVCTDLWWVSIVDGDEGDRCGLSLHDEDHEVTEVSVTSGLYTLEYHVLKKDFVIHGDHTGPTVYAQLTRRGPC